MGLDHEKRLNFLELDKPYVIAEAGINHNGDLDIAFKMIEAAKKCGADAVKFQTFKAEEFCGDPKQMFTYTSQGESVTESMLDMFKRVEFTEGDWYKIRKHADTVGIEFLSTPQNLGDLELLMKLGVSAIKVGSDDLTNEPLIQKYSLSGLPLILSTGMSDEVEIESALIASGFHEGNSVALLVCTSQYPTPPQDVNISRVITLRTKYPTLTLGFSDHTEGNEAAILSVGLGAIIFEKHFTLDHQLPGPDHWFSPDPTELKKWVESIHLAYQMKGTGALTPSKAELEMRILARRSVTVIKEIKKGEKFSELNLGQRRPGDGIPPKDISRFLDKVAQKDLNVGHKVSFQDIG
jgi:N-acetylneuraminate synthase/N,N'-diacetyllegionaminate synthase